MGMYEGTITLSGQPITVEQAVELGLVVVDGNGDIWLSSDTARLIRISGDLVLG